MLRYTHIAPFVKVKSDLKSFTMTRDTLLQGNEIINVFTEALREDLVSTVTKLRARRSKNRGSISRKGKGFFRCRGAPSSAARDLPLVCI